MLTNLLKLPKRVVALYDYDATEEGELTFKEGDVIEVIERPGEGWYVGKLNGKIGEFPDNYVEPE